MPPANLPLICPCRQFLNEACVGRTVVTGVTGVESNFLMQNIEGVASYTHPDYSAILVFIEYLCALEVRCMISYDITIHYVYVPYILSTV